MGNGTGILIVLALAFMFVGFGSLLSEASPQEQQAYLDTVKNDPTGAATSTAAFAISYDLNSPYFKLPKWVPFTEERVFMLEDVPYPAAWDALYIVPIVLLTWFILKHTLLKNPASPVKAYALAGLIFFIVIIGSFVGVRLLAEHALQSTGADLGLQDAANSGRDKYSSSLAEKKEAVFTIIAITIIGFISYTRAIIGGRKE